MTQVSISPDMLRWACERAGFKAENLAIRFPHLEDWLENKKQPTLKQLEKFAHCTHTPIGYLFLSKPPVEHLPIADFRTVSGVTDGKPSVDLLDTLYTMQRRQNWLRETLVGNGADPLPFSGSANITDSPTAVGMEMRGLLGLGADWAASVPDWRNAVSEFRRTIERFGVMAVINGIVGNNTHRKLDVREFRGFALVDEYAPLIFVNGADAKSAQMFTLAHELAHIWLGKEGISGFETLLPTGADVEKWCGQAAAELLVPEQELTKHWSHFAETEDQYGKLSRLFKVSRIVVARRALDLGFIDRDAFVDFYAKPANRQQASSNGRGGGDFHATQNSRIGELFANQVLRAATEGRIGFKEAYDLTGLNGGAFQNYARIIDGAPMEEPILRPTPVT